ncbi:MFS transporter [Massilia putida]|uniref:MFS transporter n=1 Tax=Massilia putida TaxID=1141883 RepID=UPI0009524666|nr:MFS transporter [Massilia putida]
MLEDKSAYAAGSLRYTVAGLAIVVFWLLFGEFAIAFRDRSAIPGVMELLRQHHASDTMIAVLVSALPALLGCVLVPIVGFRSDRFRSRWGRRLPFLLGITPVAALALAALGNCTAFGRVTDRLLGTMSPGADACVLAWFCLFWTVFEGVALVTVALYAGLVNDIVPRTVLGRFYGAFRIVSLIAGILFNLWVFRLTEHHLREVFLGIGLFFGIACMLMCVRIKEGEYGPPAVDGQGPLTWRAMGRAYWRDCFADRYFLLVFLALTASELTFMPFNTFSQLYAESLGMEKAQLGKLLATSYALSIGLSSVIGWLVDRYSAASVTVWTMGLYLCVACGGFLAVQDLHSFAVVYVLHVVVAGTYYTAAASLPMVLFPRARFLQFDGAKRVLFSTSNIALSFLLGPMLDSTSHDYGLTLLAGALLALASVVTFRRLSRAARGRVGAASSA